MVADMGVSEDDLQIAIVTYLKTLIAYELKGRLGYLHISNEAGLRAGIGWHAKRKRMGLIPGVPDLLLLLPNGVSYWVELKMDRLKTKRAEPLKLLSEAQIDFRHMVKGLGFKHSVLCCKNVEEGIDGIKRILQAELGVF